MTFCDTLSTENYPGCLVPGHPNVALFITHGGLLSMTEAVYHGVPMVGIPIFGDQKMNVARMIKHGIGYRVKYNELTEETFGMAINKVLSDSS